LSQFLFFLFYQWNRRVSFATSPCDVDCGITILPPILLHRCSCSSYLYGAKKNTDGRCFNVSPQFSCFCNHPFCLLQVAFPSTVHTLCVFLTSSQIL
jgi:hypothetical protein